MRSKIIGITQMLLSDQVGQDTFSATVIEEKVKAAASAVGAEPDFDTQSIVDEFIRRYSEWVGLDCTLTDNEDHNEWLIGSRKKDWRYWARYQTSLNQKLSEAATLALDKSTDDILGLLEDPQREGPWDRRGLVVGHVQSGKTGNYTGLICKAADAGYKIIIVLAGMHNNLRSQTQIRLEEGFLGYITARDGSHRMPIGVGAVDPDSSIRPNCITTREDNGDFNTKQAKALNITPEQRPWLFVIKKNKTVLQQLLEWLRKQVADSKGSDGKPIVTKLPLLMIDDEADNASVDTGDKALDVDGNANEEHQPKAINSRIRKILKCFSRSAYVGYTATPFANIFIHRNNETNSEGPDLFPRSFIRNLSAPSSYSGPTRMFGLKGGDGERNGLPLTRSIDDFDDEGGKSGWMPFKHKKTHLPRIKGEDDLPDSLKQAIQSFVLSCTVRSLRGQSSEHASMLVHVTRFTDVQGLVRDQIYGYLQRMTQSLTRGIGDAPWLAELENLWRKDFIVTASKLREMEPQNKEHIELPAWGEVKKLLADIVVDIEVKAINGTAKDTLDYEQRKSMGLKVIAIGGDKLARGLTLEGLSTSYFIRSTKMYDTLMQMGRWFGYRPGYQDLCRLFTTPDLIEWFGHIADASEELREEFETMAASGAKPKDYGLKVQSHPVLTVTSPLKMKSAKPLKLSFSGDVQETVSFYLDSKHLKKNITALENFIQSIGEPSTRDYIVREREGHKNTWPGHYWENIQATSVIDFLNEYSTRSTARRVNSRVLGEFVTKMAEHGELTQWSVVLMGGGSGPAAKIAGLTLANTLQRATHSVDNGNGLGDATGYSIRRLLSSRDESIVLSDKQWEAAMDLTLKSCRYDPARQEAADKRKVPTIPSGKSCRYIRGKGGVGVSPRRDQGLLMLYVLDNQFINPPADELIVGFGLSFPESDSDVCVEYSVDHLFWDENYA